MKNIRILWLLWQTMFFACNVSVVYANNDFQINEVMVSNIDCYLSPATNFDSWIELYNPSSEDYIIAGQYISDSKDNLKKWQFPDDMAHVPAKGYLVIWFDSNDINIYEPPIKLDADGGSVYFSNQTGAIVASIDYPPAINRTSYAKKINGEWGVTAYPTPGKENAKDGYYNTQLEEPKVDMSSQLFNDKVEVKVSIPDGTKLIYTVDGSLPTIDNGYESSDGLFSFYSTTSLRLRLFKDGWFPSEPVARTYIKYEYDFDLPIVSVYTKDEYLYDDSIGIWVDGVNGKIDNGSVTPRNWNMNWERPASFVYYKEGKSVFERDVFIKINGHYSRKKNVKSLKIKGSKVFGSKTLDYPFFDDKPYIRNRTLILRNGGSGYGNKLKDASLETIIIKSGVDMDLQAYTPAQYYLNGKFMGLINMREPTNDHYVYANYGYDDEEIDMFEMNWDYIQLCGSREAHDRWYELSKDAANDDTYQEIMKLVDIDEYLNYLAAHLFLKVDGSWPFDNTKCFRTRDGGRFRFLSYDMDAAFLIPIWSLMDTYQNFTPSVIFLNMLKNDSFRKNFIDKFCIMGGSVFAPNNSDKIIDDIAERVSPIMEWANEAPTSTASQLKTDLNNCRGTMVEDLVKFAPLGLRDGDAFHTTINSDAEGAQLFLNHTNIPTGEFEGFVFKPAVIKAIAPVGYKFEGWKINGSHEITSYNEEFVIETDGTELTASFVKEDNINTQLIVINEISADNDSYINDYFKKSDWVELYNTSSTAVDVEGMYLSDDASNLTKYKIEKGPLNINTVIPAHGYLVIWCDNSQGISQLHAPFKLSAKGGQVFLSDNDMNSVNKMEYSKMDKTETIGRYPDGGGGIYRMNIATVGKSNIYTSYLTEENQTGTGIIEQMIPKKTLNISIKDKNMIIKADGIVFMKVHSLSGSTISSELLDVRGSLKFVLTGIRKGFYIVEINDSQGNKETYKFAY